MACRHGSVCLSVLEATPARGLPQTCPGVRMLPACSRGGAAAGGEEPGGRARHGRCAAHAARGRGGHGLPPRLRHPAPRPYRWPLLAGIVHSAVTGNGWGGGGEGSSSSSSSSTVLLSRSAGHAAAVRCSDASAAACSLSSPAGTSASYSALSDRPPALPLPWPRRPQRAAG